MTEIRGIKTFGMVVTLAKVSDDGHQGVQSQVLYMRLIVMGIT